jgi:hypothetical protein
MSVLALTFIAIAHNRSIYADRYGRRYAVRRGSRKVASRQFALGVGLVISIDCLAFLELQCAERVSGWAIEY